MRCCVLVDRALDAMRAWCPRGVGAGRRLSPATDSCPGRGPAMSAPWRAREPGGALGSQDRPLVKTGAELIGSARSGRCHGRVGRLGQASNGVLEAHLGRGHLVRGAPASRRALGRSVTRAPVPDVEAQSATSPPGSSGRPGRPRQRHRDRFPEPGSRGSGGRGRRGHVRRGDSAGQGLRVHVGERGIPGDADQRVNYAARPTSSDASSSSRSSSGR